MAASPHADAGAAVGRGPLGLTGYQWLVIGAAWLGWGFDVFDALLFNFVAPNCVPVLLGLEIGSEAAREATVFWTGALTAVLLVGWAIGGVLFGWYADRYGRRRALLVTVLIYAIGTGLCAAVTEMWQLIVCRAIASLGIGGEWAIGAALVAEVVPDRRRIEAGTILYTASPVGLLLASALNYQVAGVWFADEPENSWRYVFLFGLTPVLLVFIVRAFIDESGAWVAARARAAAPHVRELFTPELRRATLTAVFVSVVGIMTWWACNAFTPLLGAWLAMEHAPNRVEEWKSLASNAFNLGGLIGALCAVPLSWRFGRRAVYVLYFSWSTIAIFTVFGADFAPELRLRLLFLVGLGVFGIFSTYVFYLPELFPARLRATGAGFSFNIGRILAALGPLIVSIVAAGAGGSASALLDTIWWVGVIPLLAAIAVPFVLIETRGKPLPQ
jgi:MFS family permease